MPLASKIFLETEYYIYRHYMITYQNFKIYLPESTDESNCRHIRAGYDIESKPSYSEKKLARFSTFFHW